MTKKHKKILLFFTLFLILGVFAAIQDLHIQKNTNSHAAASTTLSFTNAAQGIIPGGTETVDVNVDPGNNYVSLINLYIDYDSTKLTPTQNGFTPNTQAFTQTLDGPIYNTCNGNQCTMYIALSVGNDPTKAIKAPTKVATLSFQAVSAGATQLSFDTKTQVFSVAPNDQSSENVLSTANPSTITIGGTGGITPTIVGGSPTTGAPTDTPTPSNSINTPSPVLTAATTTINVQLAFPGIGANGGNLHPLHPIRDITFYLYNVDTGNLTTKANSVVFDGSYFTRPVIDLGQIPSGNYQIFIRSPQFLTSRLSQGNNSSTIQLQSGQTAQTQANTLIPGDIAPIKGNSIGDNILDIYDYNALLSCYGNRANQPICLNKLLADLDDNGVIDAVDYNILLRSFALTHQGDTIPGRAVLGAQMLHHFIQSNPQ